MNNSGQVIRYHIAWDWSVKYVHCSDSYTKIPLILFFSIFSSHPLVP